MSCLFPWWQLLQYKEHLRIADENKRRDFLKSCLRWVLQPTILQTLQSDVVSSWRKHWSGDCQNKTLCLFVCLLSLPFSAEDSAHVQDHYTLLERQIIIEVTDTCRRCTCWTPVRAVVCVPTVVSVSLLGGWPAGWAWRESRNLPEVSQKSFDSPHATGDNAVLLLLLPLRRARG